MLGCLCLSLLAPLDTPLTAEHAQICPETPLPAILLPYPYSDMPFTVFLSLFADYISIDQLLAIPLIWLLHHMLFWLAGWLALFVFTALLPAVCRARDKLGLAIVEEGLLVIIPMIIIWNG